MKNTLDVTGIFDKKPYDYEIHHPSKDLKEVVFECKAPSLKEDMGFAKKHPGKTVVDEKGESHTEDADVYEIGREKFLATVVGWRGITEKGEDGKPKPWPCTDENKTLLYDRHFEHIGKYILDKIKELAAAEIGMQSGN